MAIIGIIKLRIRPVILVDEFFNPMFLAANPRCYGGPKLFTDRQTIRDAEAWRPTPVAMVVQRAGDIIGSSDLRIP